MPAQLLPQRPLGATGLAVSALGLGAAELGDADLDDGRVADLLAVALDLGVTFIDTARSYGASEERLGRMLAPHRGRVVLSTKVGYGIAGVPDWTWDAVARGVDEALVRLGTDVLDVVHLHSCPLETLERGEVVGALEAAVKAGKVRVAAYSGENDALRHAVACGRFGAVQTSVNLCDQRDIDTVLADARTKGVGVVGKRPMANAPWRFTDRPVGHYAGDYWDRLRAMDLDPGLPWPEVALRFAVWSAGVDTAIVGTASLEHLRQNVRLVARGPLPDDLVAAIRAAFRRCDDGWVGLI